MNFFPKVESSEAMTDGPEEDEIKQNSHFEQEYYEEQREQEIHQNYLANGFAERVREGEKDFKTQFYKECSHYPAPVRQLLEQIFTLAQTSEDIRFCNIQSVMIELQQKHKIITHLTVKEIPGFLELLEGDMAI